MVEQIVLWLTFLVEKIGYFGVMLSMFTESFFVPIPSELIMPFAGFIASQGKMNLALVIVLGGISSYLGTLPFYFLGYLGGKGRVEGFLKKYGKYLFISPTDIDKSFKIFGQHEKTIVLFGRVIPVIRSLISIPAGIARMNFTVFSIYTIIGATVWSGLLAGLGYILGSNWTVVGDYISKYENIVIIVLLLGIAGFLISKVIYRNK